jgi:ABC-type multidrug transport system fused ATPase/permease subunit
MDLRMIYIVLPPNPSAHQKHTFSLVNIYLSILNTPYILLIIPLILLFLINFIHSYLKTNRHLSKLANLTFSPIISNCNETLSGTTTIRAFNQQQLLVTKNYELYDTSMNVKFWQEGVNRWIGVRIAGITSLVIVLVLAFWVSFGEKCGGKLVLKDKWGAKIIFGKWGNYDLVMGMVVYP